MHVEARPVVLDETEVGESVPKPLPPTLRMYRKPPWRGQGAFTLHLTFMCTAHPLHRGARLVRARSYSARRTVIRGTSFATCAAGSCVNFVNKPLCV